MELRARLNTRHFGREGGVEKRKPLSHYYSNPSVQSDLSRELWVTVPLFARHAWMLAYQGLTARWMRDGKGCEEETKRRAIKRRGPPSRRAAQLDTQ